MKIEMAQLKKLTDYWGPFEDVEFCDVRQKRNGHIIFSGFNPKVGAIVTVTFDGLTMRVVKPETSVAAESK